MEKLKIYLAGAIIKESEEFCRSWRDFVKHYLEDKNIKFLDPIKGKDLDKDYNSKLIYTSDMRMVNKADIILAEMCLKDRPYIGTSMELQEAFREGKTIFLWGKANKGHYFLETIADEWYDSLEYAVMDLKKFTSEIMKGEKRFLERE